MQESDAQEGKTVTGRIKWFDPVKGFGFVTTEPTGPDVLLHANVLRNFGQGSVADGSEVEIVVQKTPRGLQASEVLGITPPPPDENVHLADMAAVSPEEIASYTVQPARVKWFDKGKGFGFANVFGDSRDVFVHIEVVRRSGLADLATGEAVGLRVMEGNRGLMAIEVSGWEASDA
ncbi:cold-shock protein [Yoonia sp. R2331]|uniref:cold-shock protein n=1 Tax=Yoonia sp. R2331 TaxID=3237238 RepID=UPI0034E5EDEB